MGKTSRMLLLLVGTLGVVALALRRRIFPDVQEPPYEVERTVDGLEVRDYPPVVVAETDVDGPYRASISSGFRRLAGYIFGGNSPKQKIAMTAPVGATPHAAGRWTISFVMPPARPLAELPRPLDERVRLRQVGRRHVAVLRFRGRAGERELRARQAELAHRLSQAGLRATGEPQLAQYDPPWIPGPLRRNEMMVALDEGTTSPRSGDASF